MKTIVCAFVALVMLFMFTGCGGGNSSIVPPSDPPTIILTANKLDTVTGEEIILVWESNNATRVVGSNFGATVISGTKSVIPTETITYAITVGNNGGESTATVNIYVNDGRIIYGVLSPTGSNIYSMLPDGRDKKFLAASTGLFNITWDNQIVFAKSDGLYLMNYDGANVRKISNYRGHLYTDEQTLLEVICSGSVLLDVKPSGESDYVNTYKLKAFNLDGSGSRYIDTPNYMTSDGEICILADGTIFIGTAFRDWNSPYITREIYKKKLTDDTWTLVDSEPITSGGTFEVIQSITANVDGSFLLVEPYVGSNYFWQNGEFIDIGISGWHSSFNANASRLAYTAISKIDGKTGAIFILDGTGIKKEITYGMWPHWTH